MNKYHWFALAVMAVSFTTAGFCIVQGVKAADALTGGASK